MTGTSVRKLVGDSAVLTGLSRADTIATLRSRMAELGGEVVQPVHDDVDVVRVGEDLSHIVPFGGLPRCGVTHMSDTPALVVDMIEHVTAAGGFAGVVGWPDLSYAGVKNLRNVVAVPDPGIDPLAVAGVLVEGLDLVVYRTNAELTLSPVRARPLLAKLRGGRAALVTVGTKVQSPALQISAEVVDYHGIGQGSGRITGLDVRVRAEAKGMRPASHTVRLGAGSVSGSGSAATGRRRLRAVP